VHARRDVTRHDAELERACAWIDARLEQFRLVRSREFLLASLKALAELGHAADYLLRSRRPRAIAVGERWIDFAWNELGRGAVVRTIVNADPRYLACAATYVPFHLCGRRDDELGRLIAAQAERATMSDLEWTLMVPLLRLLDLVPSEAMPAYAARLSVLVNRPPAALMPVDAIYLLTHECPYATSFGRTPPDFDAATEAYLATTLPALLTRCRDNGDTDALAELVVAWHSVRADCTDAATWQHLHEAQTSDGNLTTQPQPSLVARRPHPSLGRTYHTTLAAIMAWSGCAHPQDSR
jgi:hypothetical protein